MDWKSIPPSVDPETGGGLYKTNRAERKRSQVNWLGYTLEHMVQDGDVIVDFGSGCGNDALPLAFRFPNCKFVLVDMKEFSIRMAQKRAEEAGLNNVECLVSKIEDFDRPFQIGIGLHACGNATDFALLKVIQNKASYLMSPCCVGKLNTLAIVDIEHPRSEWMRKKITSEQFQVIAKAGDWSEYDFEASQVISSNCDRENDSKRLCKTILEMDRNHHAKENGYQTYTISPLICRYLMKLLPLDACPKNDVIIGFHCEQRNRVFLSRIQQ